MNEWLREVFSAIVGSVRKVVMVRAQPVLDDLYNKALKLRKHKRLHRYYRHQNEFLRRQSLVTGEEA
jgi:hypothetical protein